MKRRDTKNKPENQNKAQKKGNPLCISLNTAILIIFPFQNENLLLTDVEETLKTVLTKIQNLRHISLKEAFSEQKACHLCRVLAPRIFTETEKEILYLSGKLGWSRDEIADERKVTIETVKNQRNHINKKLKKIGFYCETEKMEEAWSIAVSIGAIPEDYTDEHINS